MDTSPLDFDKGKFDAVWRRVMKAGSYTPDAPPVPAVPGDAETLRAFMDDEYCDARVYAALSAKSRGSMRQTLQHIAADERYHYKKLKAKYYILTGKTYTPPGSCPYVRSVAETLRLRYTAERQGAEAYADAAAETYSAELAALYKSLGAEEAQHAEQIGSLLEEML